MAGDRFGSALLALNTSRPPDQARGRDILHLELILPAAVASEVDAWETGVRGPLDPSEARRLLWTVPVASYLDGRREAWRDVPGIPLLLPGLEELQATKERDWPKSQQVLRDIVAAAAPGAPSRAALLKQLETDGAVALLNDLLLIFKYAAIGRRRPVRTIAEIYRLARTLLASVGAPATREDIVAWLRAPLIAPRALSGPSSVRGPSPPPPEDTGGGGGGGGGRPVPWPVNFPRIDVTSPDTVMLLTRLDRELTELERTANVSRLASALRDSGVDEPAVIARVTRAVAGDDTRDEVREGEFESRFAERQSLITAGAFGGRGRIVRTSIAGVPVNLDASEVQARTSWMRNAMARELVKALPENLQERLKRLGVHLEDLSFWPDLLAAADRSPSYLEPVGRNDLLLVRQTTTGYRRAEIGYIENVLIGETRARKHTDRTLMQQEVFESVERESEETRDLQVTDRAELSKEVSRVVNEDLRAEGSVEVTSRGPTKVVASATVSFERSTEEAAKTAEEYSRETIERAVKRTLERVKREVRSLFEQETTEINRHSFVRDDTESDHVSGIYQYLERVSRARIFWYGERELYDLLVPEPAALIWHLAITRKELQVLFEEPDSELFDSLTVANIAEKREDVVRAFRVTDLPQVPEETRSIPMTFSGSGGGDSAKYATNKELQIPEGYVVEGASFLMSADVEEEEDYNPNGGVVVGTAVQLFESPVQNNRASVQLDFSFSPPLVGPSVGVAVNVDNFRSLGGSVTVHLRLTDAAREEWALDAYGRVAERYEQLRLEYEQAVIQAEASQPEEVVALPEGTRLRLQQMVRSELQRAAIDIMRNTATDLDLISDYWFASADGSLASHPIIDLTALDGAEPEVRFLQQAFEWEHLSWILYPYFWGRRSEWSRTVVQDHPDPDFAAFMNAGAARLQIPVRPGFEGLVKHYMETGEVFEGGELPKMGDPGYVTFIDEQLTSLGAPGEEIAWPPDSPKEWDVVAPTSLILVRSTAEARLPTWDPKSGKEL